METNPNSFTELLPLETIDGVAYVDFSDIIWLKSDCRHTVIYTKNEGKTIRSNMAISDIEKMLPDTFFFKCHRCHIISLRHLKKFEKATRQILLTDNHSITIAEDRISEFLKRTNPKGYKNK